MLAPAAASAAREVHSVVFLWSQSTRTVSFLALEVDCLSAQETFRSHLTSVDVVVQRWHQPLSLPAAQVFIQRV